jgi:ubiquinone/menaquinone biosynthesis C-methylase UbiE
MARINLLKSLPISNRDVKSRNDAKTVTIVEESRKFGQMYFDGPRSYGYGGYKYDGRWIPVAKDIVDFYALRPGMRVLDIGCAKGFLVKDLMIVCPGLDVFGLDISQYAINSCEKEVIGRLHLGNATSLPFPDHSFDLVLSINTVHNLEKKSLITGLKEIDRVTKGAAFIQVDAYETLEQKVLFEEWVLTAQYHDYPEEWLKVFGEAGYKGDYDWTIL